MLHEDFCQNCDGPIPKGSKIRASLAATNCLVIGCVNEDSPTPHNSSVFSIQVIPSVFVVRFVVITISRLISRSSDEIPANNLESFEHHFKV